jgi:hypothetical protein
LDSTSKQSQVAWLGAITAGFMDRHSFVRSGSDRCRSLLAKTLADERKLTGN